MSVCLSSLSCTYATACVWRPEDKLGVGPHLLPFLRKGLCLLHVLPGLRAFWHSPVAAPNLGTGVLGLQTCYCVHFRPVLRIQASSSLYQLSHPLTPREDNFPEVKLYSIFLLKQERARETAQQAQTFATKPEDLSSIPETHIATEEN